MTQRICGILTALLIAGLCGQAIFPTTFVHAVFGTSFIMILAAGAVIVGQVPRFPRHATARLVLRSIGWPMFIGEVVLMIEACRMMLLLRESLWIDIIGYVWILAYLTWKVILYPNISPGGGSVTYQRGGPSGPPPHGVGLLAHGHRDIGAAVIGGIGALRHRPIPARLPLPPYIARDTGAVVLRGLAYFRFPIR